MKKSIGNESQNPTRDAKNAQRAMRSASAGIGLPSSTLARVHAIRRFCTRQTTPQVFSSISKPSPPPTLIARSAFDDCAVEFNSRVAHDAAITTTAIAEARIQELPRAPLAGSCRGYITA